MAAATSVHLKLRFSDRDECSVINFPVVFFFLFVFYISNGPFTPIHFGVVHDLSTLLCYSF